MGQQPNILFLFSDQQRADSVHCYGQPLAITPNLDRLAAEGVRFTEAHTPQPVCGPARACLQTGQWATRCGVPTNGVPLPTEMPLLAPTLRAAGYEAGYIGKWHLASNRRIEPQDCYRARPVPVDKRGGYLDYWLAADALEHSSHAYGGHMWDANGKQIDFPAGRFRADVVTDHLLDYLDTRAGEKPWYCFCSWIEPHHQNNHNCYEGPTGSKERFKDAPIPADLQGLEGDWHTEYADYLGCVAALDANVGRILAKLEELGQLENTIIIYTSDHGSHFRTRNGEYKRSCHRASTHIPCIIRGPGFAPGTVNDAFVSLIDLPPTMVQAAGAVVPSTFDGRPLQELLAGCDDWVDDAFVQISESQTGRSVRTTDWVYCIDQPKGSETWVEQYLYNVREDFIEHVNLIDDPSLAAVRSELRERLIARMLAAGEERPQIEVAQPA